MAKSLGVIADPEV